MALHLNSGVTCDVSWLRRAEAPRGLPAPPLPPSGGLPSTPGPVAPENRDSGILRASWALLRFDHVRPAHGTLHALRTAFLASACTALAWGGHSLWSDEPPHLAGFFAATAFLYPLLWFFTRIMRGFGDIFAVIALSQIVLHLIFQVSAGPSHGAHADGVAHSPLNHVLGFAPGMLLGHLGAALLASALLAHGESALWYFAFLLSRALPRPLRTPVLSLHRFLPCPVHRSPNFSQAPSTARGPRGPPRRLHPPRAPVRAPASRK